MVLPYADGLQLAGNAATQKAFHMEHDFHAVYRQRRIRELLDATKRPRFGSVENIRASEFVQKVTDVFLHPSIHTAIHTAILSFIQEPRVSFETCIPIQVLRGPWCCV